MKLSAYIKDHVFSLITNVICMVALSLFLLSIGLQLAEISIILTCWGIVLVLFFAAAYYYKNKHLNKLYKMTVHLDQKYLISELIGKPVTAEEGVYFDILKIANKSMLEQVSAVGRERREYKEYIEQWIHEVKTPISAIQLLCENNKSDVTRRVLCETGKLNHYVEQTLFFARMEKAEKDYLIKEAALSEIVDRAIVENKQLLLGSRIRVEFGSSPLTVYTDSKWIEFILNQLIVNAVKYKKEEAPTLTFSIQKVQNGVTLLVKDNGQGISESDLPRIFEKGFTGENGRTKQKSTGIGLYLCKRLCQKLGIDMCAESVKNEYTTFTIFFPKGTFVRLQD